MSNTPTNASGVTLTNSGPHHHRGRRLRNFILPNGREVHIALSPEEAESLRQRLTAVRGKDEPFDRKLAFSVLAKCEVRSRGLICGQNDDLNSESLQLNFFLLCLVFIS